MHVRRQLPSERGAADPLCLGAVLLSQSFSTAIPNPISSSVLFALMRAPSLDRSPSYSTPHPRYDARFRAEWAATSGEESSRRVAHILHVSVVDWLPPIQNASTAEPRTFASGLVVSDSMKS